jgi:hypothetical protein
MTLALDFQITPITLLPIQALGRQTKSARQAGPVLERSERDPRYFRSPVRDRYGASVATGSAELLLDPVTKNTGKQFSSWPVIDRYLSSCDLLHKKNTFTHEEVQLTKEDPPLHYLHCRSRESRFLSKLELPLSSAEAPSFLAVTHSVRFTSVVGALPIKQDLVSPRLPLLVTHPAPMRRSKIGKRRFHVHSANPQRSIIEDISF